MDSRELPVAFWQDVSTNPTATVPDAMSEQDQWRDTFSELGVDIGTLHATLGGQHSAVLNRSMHTYEDFYKHIIAYPAADAEPQEAESAEVSAKPSRASASNPAKRAHQDALSAANLAWREAVSQRAAALAQWDNYVRHLNLEYKRLKAMRV